MENPQDIYVSLDTARAELRKRWSKQQLRVDVENELAELFWEDFREAPRSVLWRFLASPDNGMTFFLQNAAYVAAKPLVFEYLDDVFVTLNEEKKGLGRLHVSLENHMKGTADILNFEPNQKKKITEVTLKSGESLASFHHDLLSRSGYPMTLRDISTWCHALGKPEDYYYPYLAHFITHGVLFESYLIDDEDEREVAFTNEIVIPAIKKLEERFGVRPLIVRLYPEHQTKEEDFYWWSYPPHINAYILEYASKHGLPLRTS